VAISRGHEPFHIHVDVGSRFPALISATGCCIAAFDEHDEDEIQARFNLVRWDRPAPYARWRREVEQARCARFSRDVDRYIRGVTVISAPVLRGPQVHNLLVTVGLTERLQGKVERIGRKLVQQAGRIAERLVALDHQSRLSHRVAVRRTSIAPRRLSFRSPPCDCG
jgi:DNA-binding IclR family transcriptional regulator